MTVKDFKKAARHCMYPGYTLMFSVLTFSSTRLLKLKYWFSIQILSTDFSNPLLDHPYLGMDLTYIYALLHDGYHIRSNKGMEVSWLYWSYKSHVIKKLFNWQKFKLEMNYWKENEISWWIPFNCLWNFKNRWQWVYMSSQKSGLKISLNNKYWYSCL